MQQITDREFKELVSWFQSLVGVDLSKKRILVEGRLAIYLEEKNYHNFTHLLKDIKLESNKEMLNEIIDRLTTHHTYFMREMDPLYYYKDIVLPYWEKRIKDRELRVWSAGCSSGQEPYTIAMIHEEYFKGNNKWDTRILATDISNKVLQIANQGIYDREEVKKVPKEWKRKYFTEKEDVYLVSQQIKKQVIFQYFNLMDAFLFRKRFHAIFCRNVMIYFDIPTKMELIKCFYDITEPGGYLFIGQSEGIAHDEIPYRYIKPSIYRKE